MKDKIQPKVTTCVPQMSYFALNSSKIARPPLPPDHLQIFLGFAPMAPPFTKSWVRHCSHLPRVYDPLLRREVIGYLRHVYNYNLNLLSSDNMTATKLLLRIVLCSKGAFKAQMEILTNFNSTCNVSGTKSGSPVPRLINKIH